ncbi:MAG: HAD family hydrolase [Nanoarchaeota archaeon]
MKNKFILFDFDGTIADDLKVVIDTENFLHDKYGYTTFTQNKLRRDSKFKLLFKDLKLKLTTLPLFYWRFRNAFEKNFKKIKVFPGIKDLMRKLQKDGFKIGILSSCISPHPSEHIWEFLKKNQIYNVEFVRHTHILGKTFSLKKIMEEYDLSPSEIIYVGDRVSDVNSCKVLGIETVAVTWGYGTNSDLVKSRPHYIVNNSEELYNVLVN